MENSNMKKPTAKNAIGKKYAIFIMRGEEQNELE